MSDIKSKQAKIMLYGLDEASPEYKLILELASSRSIEVKTIEADDFSQSLGYAAGLEGFPKNPEVYKGERPSHSIMWFVSVKRETLGEILREYAKTPGLRPIDLKAVLTEHNVGWSLADHYAEIQIEHRVMQAYTLLMHAEGALESMDPDSFSEATYNELEKAVADGMISVKAMQEGREVDPEVIEKQALRVKHAYQALVPNV